MNWGTALEHSVNLREQVRRELCDVADPVVDPNSILERYLVGELGLHLHASAQRAVGSPHEEKWCIDLQRVVKVEEGNHLLDEATHGLVGHLERGLGCTPEREVDIPVLIGVGEHLKYGEWVVGGSYPSLVRLVSPNDCLLYVEDARESPLTISVELRERVVDGQLYLRLIRGFETRASAVLDKLPSDVVKARSKVVDDVADNRAHEPRRIVHLANQPEDAVRLHVVLQSPGEWLRVILGPPLLFSLQSLDVFPRPIQLQPSAFQFGMSHGA